jgi:NitT/TauT family transport system substrate-binding protein
LMEPRGLGINSLADLKGRRLGVAGSALDKSWLLLRAFARDTTGNDLADIVEPIYGAPPLLSEQLKLGRLDGVLTFWNFAARLDAAGYQRLIDMADVMTSLGVTPSPPLVGFVWREALLRAKPDQVAAFFRAVSGANQVLRTEDTVWERLRPEMRPESEAEFQRLRDYFRAGIPNPWGEAETRAAERLFKILNELGGPQLVGPRTRFDPSLFWSPKA